MATWLVQLLVDCERRRSWGKKGAPYAHPFSPIIAVAVIKAINIIITITVGVIAMLCFTRFQS